MRNTIFIILFSMILVSGSVLPATFAEHLSAGSGIGAGLAGVNLPGAWYAGENLKIGDYFKYKLCHESYKDCTEFWFSMWLEKEILDGPEEMFRFQVLVEDGNKVLKGHMDVGKIAPEPIGGTVSDNILRYASVYKSSIIWLSSFATADIDQPGKGPKAFSKVSWGKIANIGGEQIGAIGIETMTVPAGEYDTVVIGWKSGGITSHIYVVDEFPFPVKASTWVQVTAGVPPQEYRFSLHEYKENVSSSPFAGFTDTGETKKDAGCITNYKLVKIFENTNTNSMVINIQYGPEKPRIGCDIEWVINFKKAFSTDLWENQVHYDILKVNLIDGQTIPIASAAEDEGYDKFFSTSGQVHRYWLMQGDPGLQKFAVIVHGTGPVYSVPNPEKFGYVILDIDLQSKKPVSGSLETLIPTPTESEISIPSWIKNNAGWWAGGLIDDASFVSGIQWLISNGVITIPPTEQATESDNVIPSWIKNNAGWWSDGSIPDNAFVSGLQWLISNGIITIS
ncbi:MAG: peptidase [Thaumarchaeota archaeon]|nr:MAG: peptidase [Nitrososphaerota archaeon]